MQGNPKVKGINSQNGSVSSYPTLVFVHTKEIEQVPAHKYLGIYPSSVLCISALHLYVALTDSLEAQFI